MFDLTKRALLRCGTALSLTTALLGLAVLSPAPAAAQEPMGSCDLQFQPEEGAELTLLRWKRFTQGEEDAFMKIVDNFKTDCGVTVNVQSESYDDIQPKASVAANVGQGPDMIWGIYSLPFLFPDKLVDVTDLAAMLGEKYGGWVDAAVEYGTRPGTDEWIDIPVAINGNYINYRKSMLEKAGYSEPPKTTAEFLEMAKKLKEQGTPVGFALGHASGDGNTWAHWALWSFGGSLVDENDEVVINSPETKAAVEYVKELYKYMAPGVAAWNDSNNNKAFMSGEISLTNNGPSIYPAAQREAPEIAEDMDHAPYPIGPVGEPREFHMAYPMMIFKYSEYPQAAKAFIEYMLQPEQFNPWVEGAVAYLTPTLKQFEDNPVFTDDPKLEPYKYAAENTKTAGYPGTVGQKAASALAEFIVMDMFANAAIGTMTVDEAIAEAERRAERIYR